MKNTSPKFKVGELVYLKHVGSPYDDWEGASCVVVNNITTTGIKYVEVEPIFRVNGMKSALFHPTQIRREDRPWLRKTIKKIIMHRDVVNSAAKKLQVMAFEFQEI